MPHILLSYNSYIRRVSCPTVQTCTDLGGPHSHLQRRGQSSTAAPKLPVVQLSSVLELVWGPAGLGYITAAELIWVWSEQERMLINRLSRMLLLPQFCVT